VQRDMNRHGGLLRARAWKQSAQDLCQSSSHCALSWDPVQYSTKTARWLPSWCEGCTYLWREC